MAPRNNLFVRAEEWFYWHIWRYVVWSPSREMKKAWDNFGPGFAEGWAKAGAIDAEVRVVETDHARLLDKGEGDDRGEV